MADDVVSVVEAVVSTSVLSQDGAVTGFAIFSCGNTEIWLLPIIVSIYFFCEFS